MTTRLLVLFACGLLGACSDLRDLGEPVCGNGLIEPGEDCDSPLERCDRCSIVCAASDDCNAITGGGYVCGPDLRCHAPAGTFVRTQPVHINVDAVRIADVSQPPDGFGDLLAKSSAAVTVAYGAADGLSTARVSVQAPTSQGPVTFARLDGGGILMALIAGWLLPSSVTAEELLHPHPLHLRVWRLLIRYLGPAAVVMIFLSNLGW